MMIAVAALSLAACSPGGGESEAPPAVEPQPHDLKPSWREDRRELGEATYELACASCHDSGKLGAPLTGNREQWSGRSDMWQAVLFEHAKEGYLEMPGKGGRPELSDEAVEAAAEYMLAETFPELPTD
jgi:cytochrome c5